MHIGSTSSRLSKNIVTTMVHFRTRPSLIASGLRREVQQQGMIAVASTHSPTIRIMFMLLSRISCMNIVPGDAKNLLPSRLKILKRVIVLTYQIAFTMASPTIDSYQTTQGRRTTTSLSRILLWMRRIPRSRHFHAFSVVILSLAIKLPRHYLSGCPTRPVVRMAILESSGNLHHNNNS